MEKACRGSEKPRAPAQPASLQPPLKAKALVASSPWAQLSFLFQYRFDFPAKSLLCAKLAVNLTFLARGKEGTSKSCSWVIPCTDGFIPQAPQERGFAPGSACTGDASPQLLAR